MCALCKMAISEKRLAAEFIDSEGNAVKFDDFGCMMQYLAKQGSKQKVQAHYVMDYSQLRWISGEQAIYVKSNAIHTPMGSGIIAFRDRSQADKHARKFQGKVLTFGELANSRLE